MTKSLPEDSQVDFWGRIKQIARILFYRPYIYTVDIQRQNIQKQIESEGALQESNRHFQQEIEANRQQFELARLKAQYLMQLERQDFDAEQAKQNRELQIQIEQAKLSQEFQADLTAYIQQSQNVRELNRKDFEKILLVERQKLELEVQRREHELLFKLAGLQGQIVRQTEEYKHILANYPWRLYPATILDDYKKLDPAKPVPPLVIISHPEIKFEHFPTRAANLTSTEKDVEEDLRIFLNNYYNLPNETERGTNFICGAWDTKRMRSEPALNGLFSMLNSVPTIILESELNDELLNFRIASWDIGYSKYQYQPILSKFPYRNFLYRAAQKYALEWKERKENLLAQGWKMESVIELEPDNDFNLEKWEYEQKLKAAGYAKPQDYKVTRDCLQQLCSYLGILNCLIAGFAIDEYYFMRYNFPPKLPKLLPVLIQELPEYDALRLIEIVVEHYHSFLSNLAEHGSLLISEFTLSLALELINLSDKRWAIEQVVYSMQSWLKLRGLVQMQEFDPLLDALESALTSSDMAYVEKLNECLRAIGSNRSLSVMDACYNRGIKRYQQELDYQAAISDFDQAIQLNPKWAEAYYNRGLAYAKLSQYQKAIEDYTEVLRINPNWAVIYCHRGNAYYKLGQHPQSIADYNRALEINPNFSEAARKRDMVQNDWNELIPQQRAAAEKAEAQRRAKEEAERYLQSSVVGINYRQLRDLLAAEKWFEADRETTRVMLHVAGREKEGWLSDRCIQQFPSVDLRIIDQLWVEYSNGRFGFSVQKRIWESVGGQPGYYDYKVYEKFGDKIGWRVNKNWLSSIELKFTLNKDTPFGHLPTDEWLGGWGEREGWCISILSRSDL